MLAVLLLAVFASVGYCQLGPLFLPPAVKFINSDFNETVTGVPLTPYGHFDYLQGNNMHLIANAQGFSVEEWIVDGTSSFDVYIITNGQCSKQTVPIPSIDCAGWTQVTPAVWSQVCNFKAPQEGSVTVTVKVTNSQAAWLKQTTKVSGQTVEATLTFTNTNSVPPSSATLQPPANCGTTADATAPRSRLANLYGHN